MKYRLVIWGTGAVYNRHVNLLKYYELKNEIEIIAVTSSDIAHTQTIDGYKTVPLNGISSLTFDFILIMNDASVLEIKESAVNMGVGSEQILFYKILEIPNLVFDQYIKLKQSRISIISNNCWGGTIYNTLGMECLSPFKNLFLEDDSYLKMLGNLEYYLECEPDVGGFATDVHSGKRYPVLKLDDVLVHCNHDLEHETAIRNWKRRLKKINRDNLFIEMYTEDKQSAEKFVQLEGYSRKVCFVPFASNEKELYHLPLFPGQSELWEAVISSARNGKNSISYNIIELLSGKNCRRYN